MMPSIKMERNITMINVIDITGALNSAKIIFFCLFGVQATHAVLPAMFVDGRSGLIEMAGEGSQVVIVGIQDEDS